MHCLRGDNVTLKVRLQAIDAPELGQPFGRASRERLAELVMRKDVVLHEHGKDKFGRTLGWLEVGGADVAAQMLADGLAWHYVKYDHSQTLAEAEQSARAAKRGLRADAKHCRRGSGEPASMSARRWWCRLGDRARRGGTLSPSPPHYSLISGQTLMEVLLTGLSLAGGSLPSPECYASPTASCGPAGCLSTACKPLP